VRRAGPVLLALAVALAVAACGGAGAGASEESRSGEGATLWVTRDAGAEVLVEASVPAGIDAIEALERHAEVETRYGGRFVAAVNGIEGRLERQEDWFYFLNGIEADLGGAELRLRPGDVIWWDFRSWRESMRRPVVVGAFPEPFLHGWDGRRRPAEVVGPPELADEADALRDVLGGSAGEGEPNRFVLAVDEAAEGARLTAERGARNDAPVTFTLAGSRAAVRAAATALARDPAVVRFRFEARFDEAGRVLE
jgi:Domain of unknown function (DUF4430)